VRSRNPYLFRTVEWLRSEFFTPLDLILRICNVQDSAGEHHAILDAIRDHDGRAAEAAMRRHLESTRHALDDLPAP
jgi:DNA-binding GntR family transcriptional regulator